MSSTSSILQPSPKLELGAKAHSRIRTDDPSHTKGVRYHYAMRALIGKPRVELGLEAPKAPVLP